MRAKVSKCHVLAIRRWKGIDPQLSLNSLPISPVGDDSIKFLGMPWSSKSGVQVAGPNGQGYYIIYIIHLVQTAAQT